MANSIVRLPLGYFPDPKRGRPLFNAKIWIGEPDTLPADIPANQKLVTGRQEDGTEIPLAQPIRTSAGGIPVDADGNYVTLLVDGAYSMRVDDRNDNQVYYFADVLDGAPVTFDVFGETLAEYTNVDFKTVADAKAGLLPDGVSTINLEVGYKVTTRDYYSSNRGGGGEYVVVAGGTGTDDGGTYIDLDNGNQLELITTRIINIKQWGAVGDAATNPSNDDTASIDNAIAYYDAVGFEDGDPINGSRDIFLVTDAPVLYAPAGNYNYNGTGYVPDNNKVFVFKGDSPASTMINIVSDVHFCNPQNSSKVMAYVELSDIKFNGGRGAFFNEKTDVGNVAQGKRSINVAYTGYTSVAFGSIQLSDARWYIEACWFDAGDTGTPVAIAMPHEVAEINISGCQFGGNKYDILTFNDGISEQNIGPNNSFFTTAGRTKEAFIWFLAGDSRQGNGVKVSYNRFSNENLDASKPAFLIADRDNTTDSHVFDHSTTVSNNNFSEVSITNNSIGSNGNPEDTDHIAYIQSYVSSVKGWRWSENRITQWRPRIIDFAAGITEQEIDEAGVGISNLFELNNQAVVDSYNPIALSNLKGAGMVRYDDWVMMGMPEQISTFKNNPSDVTNLTFTSNTRGSLTGVNVTQADIADSQGGATGSTFTYAADENVILISSIDTNGIQGKVAWIEFEVKKSAATPLPAIQLEIVIQGKVNFYSLALDDNWQNVRIPFIFGADASTSGDVTIQLTPTLFLDIGVADSFDIGRKVIYHSSTPVPYSEVAI